MKFKFRLLSLALWMGLVFVQNPSAEAASPFYIHYKDNTHLIDSNEQGFAIYRTSKPNQVADFKKLCALGVREIMVLDGTGEKDQALADKHCPGFKVIYNEQQKVKIPMTLEFLAKFDVWVAEAKAQGKKIAFRCNCGCHRTGRLAAYYQMKYQGLSAKAANKIMKKHGKYMIAFPQLDNQVRALKDHIEGRRCSERKKHCVRDVEPSVAEIEEALAAGPEEI